MREETIKVYQYHELPDTAKEKVRKWWLSVMDTSDWYDFTAEDAEAVGIRVSSVDCYRRSITGEFTEGAEYTANKILQEHGESCDTYKLAKQYQQDRDALVEKYSDGINKNAVADGNEWDFDNECDALDTEFLDSILEEYLSMFIANYEYCESEEAISEAMAANGYEFTENGKRY